MKTLIVILSLLVILCVPARSQTHSYDSSFWNTALVWHGDLTVHEFAELLKAHAMQESGMHPNARREEQGYLTGRYQAQVRKTAKQYQHYLTSCDYYESLFTIETDLSRSFGLVQIMGERAYELGWKQCDFYDDSVGLLNVDTGLYYGAKLIHINLERYHYDITKAISAYNAGSYTTRNRAYVQNILKFLKMYEHDFDSFQEP